MIARPGDVILTHYQTAHHVAPNFSPDVRFAIYFRLFSTARDRWSWCPEALTNIWLEFEGMHEIASERERTEAEAMWK